MHETLRLLEEFDEATTRRFLDAGAERSVAAGTAIATEGEALDELLVVLHGTFDVRLRGIEGDAIATLGPGELVGEISFLESRPASATVVAAEEGYVLAIPHAALEKMAAEDPAAGASLYRGMARVLSRRLRERSPRLARTDDGVGATAAWTAARPAVDELKEALRAADVEASKHGGEIPAATCEAIERQFEQLCAGLTELVSSADAAVLPDLEVAVQRELVPYVHLTRIAERIYTKPRGYAGDFLTIQWMYGNDVGGVAPLGPLVDRLFLDRPSAKAVRNRRGLLADEIARTLERTGGKAKVTSLACGPAEELFDVFEGGSPDLDATLLDIDLQALAFVSDRRDKVGLRKNMRLEQANLVYLATGRRTLDLKPQDLMYSIGLIDYFADKFVVALLNWVHASLAPGGRVVLGNFHTKNPDKALMDLVLDWKLIHRDEDDMNRLFESSAFGKPCTEIRYEEEGINLFACCEKD